MIKLILLVAFPILVAANLPEYMVKSAPSCFKKECAKDHFAFHACYNQFTKDSTLKNKSDQADQFRMKEEIKVQKRLAKCLDNVSCSAASCLQFFLDSLIPVEELLYGDAFKCVQKGNVIDKMEHCFSKHSGNLTRFGRTNTTVVYENRHKIALCSDERLFELEECDEASRNSIAAAIRTAIVSAEILNKKKGVSTFP